MLKRILIAFGISFALATAGLIAALKTGYLTENMRDYISAEITKNTGKIIAIERIELGFINNVVFRNISIPVKLTESEAGELMTVRAVIFRFNLFDYIFKKKSIEKTLSSVIVQGADVKIVKEKGALNVMGFSVASPGQAKAGSKGSGFVLPLPIDRIFIEDGRVDYTDKDAGFKTTLAGLKGNIAIKGALEQIKVFLAARTNNSIRNNVKLSFGIKPSTGRFDGALSVDSADLAYWGNYLAGVKQLFSAGNFSAEVKAQGTEFSPEKMELTGSLKAEGGEIKLGGSPAVKNITADISLLHGNVYFNNMAFNIYGGNGIVKGGVKDIFGNKQYDAEASVSGVSLAEINRENLSGQARASASIKGSAENELAASGSVSVESAQLAGVPLKDFELVSEYRDGVAKISSVKGSFGGGVISGSGSARTGKKDKKISAVFGISGMSASRMFKNIGLKGSGNAEFRAGGTVDRPVLGIKLDTESLKYKNVELEQFAGSAEYSGSTLTVQAGFSYLGRERSQLDATAVLNNGSITLSGLDLFEGKKKILTASGSYETKTDAIALDAKLTDLDITAPGISYINSRDIKGSVNGAMNIKGTLASPVLSLNVGSKKLAVKGTEYRLGFDATYGNNSVTVRDFSLSKKMKSSAEISLKKRIFNASVQLSGLEGDTAAELTGLKALAGSVINGQASVKKGADGYGGSTDIDVDFSSGDYKKIKLQMSGENNDFKITKAEAMQKEGFASLSGSFSVKKEQDVTVNMKGRLSDFRVNDKLKVTASMSNSAKARITDEGVSSSGRMSFTEVLFNKKNMDDLEILLKTNKYDVQDFRLNWGTAYSAAGNSFVRDGSEREIAAELKIRAADLYPVYTLAGKADRALAADSVVDGMVKVTGPLSKLRAEAVISQKQGSVSAEGTLETGKGKEGPEIKKMNFTYTAVNTDLKTFAGLFDEKFSDSGRLNGKGSLSGNPDSPQAEGSFVLKDGAVAGFACDDFSLDYRFRDKKFLAEKAVLNYKNTYMKLNGTELEFRGRGDYYLTLKTELKDYKVRGNWLNGNLNFYGMINNDKTLKVDGAVSSDNFNFKLHKFEPFLIKINIDNDRCTLKTIKGKAPLAADIQITEDKVIVNKLSATTETGREFLSASGFIHKKDGGESDLTITMDDYIPQHVNDLLGWDYKWGGSLSGNVKISRNPVQGLAFTIFLTIKNGFVNGVDYDVLTGLLLLKDHWVDFAPYGPMSLTKEGKYDIKMTGKIPVPMSEQGVEMLKGVEMNLHASLVDGDVSILKFLKFIDSGEGKLDAEIDIKGTKEYPSVSGTLDITDATIKLKYIFDTLKHVYGNFLIKDNVIDIYTLRGDAKNGTLKIENLNEKKGGLMKHIKVSEFNMRVTNIGDKLRISDTPYMEFLDGDADVDLEVTGPADAPFVKGSIKLSNAKYTYPMKMKTEKGDIADSQDNYAKRITWDVGVEGAENLIYYSNYGNNFIEANMKIDNGPLFFKGKGNALEIAGNVRIPKGAFKYMNTEFSIDDMRESRAVFDGDRRPVLDVYATSKLKRIQLNAEDRPSDVTVNLHTYGRVGDVKIDVTSDPDLDRNRIFYILTFGTDIAPGTDMQKFGSEATKLAADALANFWLKRGAQEIKKYTPLDFIDIKYRASDLLGGGKQEQKEPGTGTAPAPSESPVAETAAGVTQAARAEAQVKFELGMGKYLTDQLYLDYNLRLLDRSGLITDPATQAAMDLQHELGIEFSLDETNKIKAYKTFGDETFAPQENFIGWENRRSFESWGMKQKKATAASGTPTPTPER